MTKPEGRGVLTLLQLLEVTTRRLGETGARSLIDGLDDNELSDLAVAISAAERAATGEPNLIYESLAARVRGVDVATYGSSTHEEERSDACTEA